MDNDLEQNCKPNVLMDSKTFINTCPKPNDVFAQNQYLKDVGNNWFIYLAQYKCKSDDEQRLFSEYSHKFVEHLQQKHLKDPFLMSPTLTKLVPISDLLLYQQKQLEQQKLELDMQKQQLEAEQRQRYDEFLASQRDCATMTTYRTTNPSPSNKNNAQTHDNKFAGAEHKTEPLLKVNASGIYLAPNCCYTERQKHEKHIGDAGHLTTRHYIENQSCSFNMMGPPMPPAQRATPVTQARWPLPLHPGFAIDIRPSILCQIVRQPQAAHQLAAIQTSSFSPFVGKDGRTPRMSSVQENMQQQNKICYNVEQLHNIKNELSLCSERLNDKNEMLQYKINQLQNITGPFAQLNIDAGMEVPIKIESNAEKTTTAATFVDAVTTMINTAIEDLGATCLNYQQVDLDCEQAFDQYADTDGRENPVGKVLDESTDELQQEDGLEISAQDLSDSEVGNVSLAENNDAEINEQNGEVGLRVQNCEIDKMKVIGENFGLEAFEQEHKLQEQTFEPVDIEKNCETAQNCCIL